MSAEQPYVQGREANERLVIEEMIQNPASDHWQKCLEFVTKSVYAKTGKMAIGDKEDIVQEVMYKTRKYLPNFRFGSKLKTWLYPIISSCINDHYRANRYLGSRLDENLYRYVTQLLDEDDTPAGEFAEPPLDELFERQEKIRKGVHALLDHVNSHAHSARNKLILRSVIFEGDTYMQAAEKADCDAAVVGYVVREAQRYARGADRTGRRVTNERVAM